MHTDITKTQIWYCAK